MTHKPERMPIAWENVPSQLKASKNWIVWNWEVRDGALTKPPRQINRAFAKSNDPTTWTSLDEIRAAYDSGDWDGIGFMLNNGLVGVDFDDCIVDGKVQKGIYDWVRR